LITSEEPILIRTMFLGNSLHKVVVYQHTATSLLLRVVKMPEGFSDNLYVDFPQQELKRFVARVDLIEQMLVKIDVDLAGRPFLQDSQYN
jgi:hypothetical protein